MNDFGRERRYYVIKIKDLSESQHAGLSTIFSGLQIPCTDSVVVESDWPNYEHTWKTIEKVSQGVFVDPYLEIERWKRVAHDQAETIGDLDRLVHDQKQSMTAMAEENEQLRTRVAELEFHADAVVRADSPANEACRVRALGKVLERTQSYEFILRKQAEAVASLRFPTLLRKMWAGHEVQNWLDDQTKLHYDEAEKAGGET